MVQKALREAVNKGLREVKREIALANTVAQDIVDGLHFLEARAGVDLGVVVEDIEHSVMIHTSLPAHFKDGDGCLLFLKVFPGGAISIFGDATIEGAPQDCTKDAASIVQTITKMVALSALMPATPVKRKGPSIIPI